MASGIMSSCKTFLAVMHLFNVAKLEQDRCHLSRPRNKEQSILQTRRGQSLGTRAFIFQPGPGGSCHSNQMNIWLILALYCPTLHVWLLFQALFNSAVSLVFTYTLRSQGCIYLHITLFCSYSRLACDLC